MLQGCAELSHKHDLPVYTHVYETRGQRLIARELFAEHDGSLITYMERNGLLGSKLNIVHSVWITRPEMDRMAAADAGIVLNHLSNLKLKSGIAPVLDLREAGVGQALADVHERSGGVAQPEQVAPQQVQPLDVGAIHRPR